MPPTPAHMGLLQRPGAPDLPKIGEDGKERDPVEYADYFCESEERIPELYARISAIKRAYVNHSNKAIAAGRDIAEGADDAEGDNMVHILGLFKAAEEHEVLMIPLLHWMGYPDRLKDPTHRTTCTLLATEALKFKQRMIDAPEMAPLLEFAYTQFGVLAF